MDSAEPSSRRRATVSQHEQWTVQEQVFQIYETFANVPPQAQTLMLELQRDEHMEYLTRGLKQLSPSFVVLDANRPWLCYWILHSIALLGDSIDYELENNAIDFLNRCQDPNGGYGGGPGQLPHLATTYAAVNSLVTLGGRRALSSINRGKLYTFLRRMKDPSGPFRMHDAGEIDVRACYTAISVASILNILDDELVKDVGDYIISCQTYEGGIAGEPGSEAHELGGISTRSGVWISGRTNKLVDGCYSFWQGGVFALLQRLHSIGGEHASFPDAEAGHCATESSSEEEDTDQDSSEVDETCHFKQGVCHGETVPLFHSLALQQYIILCSQEQKGGFRDKPRKARDYYHTCYCLSGLSVCQYSWSKDENSPPLPRAVLGPYSNLLEPIHPLYNVVTKLYDEAREFFSTRSTSH